MENYLRGFFDKPRTGGKRKKGSSGEAKPGTSGDGEIGGTASLVHIREDSCDRVTKEGKRLEERKVPTGCPARRNKIKKTTKLETFVSSEVATSSITKRGEAGTINVVVEHN